MAKQLTEFLPTPQNWKDLKTHRLCDLIDFGIGIDIQGLSGHMKRIGYDQDEPIILIREGKQLSILDGKHRHVGAQEAGEVPVFRLFTGDDPLAYVMKKLHRQHFNQSQLAMVAAKYANAGGGRPQKPSRNETVSSETAEIPLSNAQAAAKFGVSESALDRAKTALVNGTPELQDAVKDGTVSVTDAATVSRKRPAQQRKAVKSVRAGKAKTVTEAVGRSDADETKMKLVDVEDHKVPDNLLEAFSNLDRFKALDSLARQMQSQIDELSDLPGGEQLNRFLKRTGDEGKTINKSEHLNALKRDLKGTRPHSVCPWCEGTAKKDCKGCMGSGWVTKTAWDNADEQTRERLK